MSMQEVGIEGPRMRIPGQKEDLPFYYQHAGNHNSGQTGPASQSGLFDRETAFVPDEGNSHRSTSMLRRPGSTTRTARNRGESITEMSKRLDFSLGMKDVSSADMMGDLYESVTPSRAGFRRNSNPSPRTPRTIPEEDHPEDDLGRATSTSQSRFSLNRTSTESRSKVRGGHSVNHRNRFFSKRSKKEPTGSEYEDLMEQGMADIPEALEKIDPRSGLVSPLAVRTNTEPDFSSMDFSKSRSTASGGLPEYVPNDDRRGLTRAETETYEMKPMD